MIKNSGLRRYDTIKTCESGLKTGGSSCFFLSSRGQKIRNITKIEPRRVFLFAFCFHFLMVFQVQKLIYTINI